MYPFKKILLNLFGWLWLIRLYKFQAYNSIIHSLCSLHKVLNHFLGRWNWITPRMIIINVFFLAFVFSKHRVLRLPLHFCRIMVSSKAKASLNWHLHCCICALCGPCSHPLFAGCLLKVLLNSSAVPSECRWVIHFTKIVSTLRVEIVNRTIWYRVLQYHIVIFCCYW